MAGLAAGLDVAYLTVAPAARCLAAAQVAETPLVAADTTKQQVSSHEQSAP